MVYPKRELEQTTFWKVIKQSGSHHQRPPGESRKLNESISKSRTNFQSFQERSSNTNESPGEIRKRTSQVSDIKFIEALKLIRVKVGGAKESFHKIEPG